MGYEFEAAGPVFFSSVPQCVADPANYQIAQERCDEIGGTYTTFLSTTTSHNYITSYAAFSLQSGEDAVLRNVYSPQLNDTRDIPYYIPPSILQNPIRRKVNMMFLFDGANETVSSFAFRAGFNNAVSTGVVPQDTLLVGITTYQYAVTGNLCERYYELTFTQCNTSLEQCKYGDCATGGTITMFLFLNETVIPLLLSKLNMDLGEVSLVGGSLGGLTACFGPAYEPTFFQRAICFSPTPYNAGALPKYVLQAWLNSPNRPLPKAIVMYMGTSDTSAAIGTPSTGYVTNGQIFYDLANAWVTVGMKMFTPATTYIGVNATYAIANEMLAPPIEHVVSAIIQYGGMHTTQSWEAYFTDALAIAFRPDFEANFTRLQRNDYARSLYIPPSPGSDNSNNDDVSVAYQQATYALTAVCGLLLIGCLYLGVLYTQAKKQLTQDGASLLMKGARGSEMSSSVAGKGENSEA